jgi:hypothetical protein
MGNRRTPDQSLQATLNLIHSFQEIADSEGYLDVNKIRQT